MESKKQKVVKILKRIGIALSVGFNVIFLIAIIIGSSGIKNKGNNVQVACAESEVVQVDSQVNKKLVSYDDSNYTINLTVEEVSNYVFANSYSYFNDYTRLSYNSLVHTGTFNSLEGCCAYEFDDFNICFITDIQAYLNNGDLYSNATQNYTFDILTFNNGWYSSSFEYGVSIIEERVNDYSAFKSALELDIEENYKSINDGIFETLTSGVVSFVGSIGSGITAMTSVFYDSTNSQLTSIGLLSVIVVAISLAYFLFRLIIGLIRMRG